MNNKLLNNIATEIVANKVMDDKMKEYENAQAQENFKENDNNVVNNVNEDDDDDDIFKIDEEEERIIQKEREKRFLDQNISTKKKARDSSTNKNNNKARYGNYIEIFEEDFLDTLLKNKKVVCHFYHDEFIKCKVMDKHLRDIAYEHSETLFVKINAEKAPFFSVKLNIKVLPTVLFSNDGKVFDRIIGFEGLDGEDDFKTISLTRKLVIAKMIKPKNKLESGEVNIKKVTKLSGYNNEYDEDSEGSDY